MVTTQQRSPMVRKQYYLSEDNIRRLEDLQSELGDSEAALVRRAIDAFDPAIPTAAEQDMIEKTALDVFNQMQALRTRIDATLERMHSARSRISDPEWIESIRERTRREAAANPVLIEGMATLLRGAGV